MNEFMGTTICAVKKDGHTAIAGDGQVTMSQSIIFKNNAVKVRRIYNGNVISGLRVRLRTRSPFPNGLKRCLISIRAI